MLGPCFRLPLFPLEVLALDFGSSIFMGKETSRVEMGGSSSKTTSVEFLMVPSMNLTPDASLLVSGEAVDGLASRSIGGIAEVAGSNRGKIS